MLICFTLIYNVSLTGLESCVHNVDIISVWYLDHQDVYMKCTNLHILITIIAGIILVTSLYILNFTVTIGTINGIIFYANIVSISDSVFFVNDSMFNPLRAFISFANLDLGIETCFYNGMDNYYKTWLQLFFPFYLIIIAASIIITSRYSTRILRLTYTRSLPVL